MYCKKCGIQLEDDALFCTACGTKVEQITTCDEQSKDTISNENSGDTKKKNKWILPVASIAVIITIAVIVLDNSKPKDKGLYNNIEWGASEAAVAKYLEENSPDTYTPMYGSFVDMYEDFYNYKGLTAIALFDFGEDDSLQGVSIMSSVTDLDYTVEEIVQTITTQFDEKYGKHTESSLGVEWKTEESSIQIWEMSEEMFFIDYDDIDLISEE